MAFQTLPNIGKKNMAGLIRLEGGERASAAVEAKLRPRYLAEAISWP